MDPITVGLAVSFGSSLLGGLMGGRSQAREAQRQYDTQVKQITANNLALSTRNAYVTGLMNMQLGLTKKQLAQQGADVRTAGLQAKGMLEANAAASGTIGASVEAARTDIQSKVDQAGQAVKDEWEQTLVNYNNDLESNRINMMNSIVVPSKPTYRGASLFDNILGSTLSTAASFGSNYALQSMRLNLGSTPTGSSSMFSADYKTNIPNLNYIGG